jgi:integrase
MKSILGILNGSDWLMAMLLYGAGLRLMECLQLRVKDIDFTSNQIIVGAGKDDKDRHTLLPTAVKAPLAKHLEIVKRQHQRDLERGLGRVALPNALERKYPNAGTEWSGNGYFLQVVTTAIESPGSNVDITCTKPFGKGCEAKRPQGRHSKTCNATHVQPFFRYPFA